MALGDAIEKLGRVIFEAPFTAGRLTEEAPELAEIRLAIIDAVKSQSHRVGSARVFAHDIVRVHLRGIPEAQAGTFQNGFLAQYFQQEVRNALARSSYRFPRELQVELCTTPQLPGPGEEWIRVETESKMIPAVQEAPRPRRVARLVVVQGTTPEPEILLKKVRTNIGRTADVFRAEGPSRKNDVAFTEDSEINRSVSREHAHIELDKKTNEYRLFNDRWYKAGPKAEANCGLWIVRDGLSQPVHRNQRGVALKPGDEIHLGRAVLKFVQR
ncbi:MAG TPA: FHA domain-containing protein [Bryobacteraceae bacterium]|nr:FHA domain-containing protein [Bryobacteraceae bacterium]